METMKDDDMTATQRTVVRCVGNLLSNQFGDWVRAGERRTNAIKEATATAWDIVAQVKVSTPRELKTATEKPSSTPQEEV